jgi:glycosyltransferase involved in cell wall biosynthesis
MKNLTVYTLAFNENIFLQYMIDHYRIRFPMCNIVVYDNESTDNTANIAISNNCEVRLFPTNNQIDDDKIRNLKNNCWKTADTDWVLVCDVDELLDINKDFLQLEEDKGTSIIQSEAYTLVNLNEDFNFSEIKHGARDGAYDKCLLFNKKLINEINYCHGAHYCSPQGIIKYSDEKYKLYHYKYINTDYHIIRNKYTFDRLSDINKRMGWGTQWHINDDQIRQMFIDLRKNAIRIIL